MAAIKDDPHDGASLSRRLRSIARDMQRLADEVDRLTAVLGAHDADPEGTVGDEQQLVQLLLAAQRPRGAQAHHGRYGQLIDMLSSLGNR